MGGQWGVWLVVSCLLLAGYDFANIVGMGFFWYILFLLMSTKKGTRSLLGDVYKNIQKCQSKRSVVKRLQDSFGTSKS